MARRAIAPDLIGRLLHPEPLAVESVRRSLGLTQAEFGRAVGRSRRTVARWSATSVAVADLAGPVAQRVRRLARLQVLLDKLVEAEAAPVWLRASNQAFGGAAPLDLVLAGRTDEVVAALEALADGGLY